MRSFHLERKNAQGGTGMAGALGTVKARDQAGTLLEARVAIFSTM